MDEIGPVDYAAFAFPGNEFKGEITPALADLVEAGTIRIIDAVFVTKNENGDVAAAELTELAPDVQEALGALHIEVNGLMNDNELLAIGAALEPNSSAALLIWENVWARKVADSIRGAGGILVGFERLPHDVVQAAREAVLEEAKSAQPST
jgi:uncharacterized membrane protein